MFDISPVQVASVFVIVEVIRGLLPSQWLNIDGKIRVWILVLVSSVILVAKGSPDITTVPELVDVLGDVVSLAIAAVLTNGAVISSGLKLPVRKIVTLNGRTNS